MNPKNQHQLVLHYLIKWEWFSLKDVINDAMFFKFQTRLSELESKHGLLARRKRVNFINQFGHESAYNIYKSVDKQKCINLFKKLNKC